MADINPAPQVVVIDTQSRIEAMMGLGMDECLESFPCLWTEPDDEEEEPEEEEPEEDNSA